MLVGSVGEVCPIGHQPAKPTSAEGPAKPHKILEGKLVDADDHDQSRFLERLRPGDGCSKANQEESGEQVLSFHGGRRKNDEWIL
jgi:hypothetical protein